MSSLKRSTAWLVGLLILWGSGLLVAADAPAPTPQAAEIATWIKKLDAARFTERSEASSKLEAAGKLACPALAEAALGESREARLRALEILQKHFTKGDPATQEAAQQALQKIADSQREPAARRAKEILNPPAPPAMPQAMPIQIGAPQIQIQVQAAAGGQTRQVRIVNGVKQIEVSENGRRVSITEDPAKGLQVEVTEKKDGKETTQKYAAKNAEEMKKQQPEGHRIYVQYIEQQPGVQIQVQPGGAFGFGGALPALAPAGAKEARRAAAVTLRHAQQLVEAAARQLENVPPDSDQAKDAKSSRQRLEKIAQQLEAERTKLE
jgi:hypothetical protein